MTPNEGRASMLSHTERPHRNRLVAGVCAGLSPRLDIDPNLLRLGFILLGFAWGLGLLAYVGLWLLMPDEAQPPPSSFGDRFRGVRIDLGRATDYLRHAWRRTDEGDWPRPAGRRWIALGLVVGGVFLLLASFGAFAWLTPARAFGLALAACGAGLLIELPR